jgi:hypothetical protein
MLRRLTLFSATSIAICTASGLAIHLFLADVVPVAWGQDPQPFWRLEAAVLLTTLQWITGIVGLLSAAGVVVLRYRRIFAT